MSPGLTGRQVRAAALWAAGAALGWAAGSAPARADATERRVDAEALRGRLEALLSLAERHGLEPDPAVLGEGLREALVRAVDPGGRVLPEEAFRELRDRRRGLAPGVGIRLERLPDGPVVLAEVDEPSPAFRAGLVSGMRLESVNGRFVADRGLDDVVRLLRAPGETVALEVFDPDSRETREVALTPAILPRRSIAVAEPWPRRLAYLRVDGLYDDAAPTVAGRLREWQEAGRFGVILDLRGAGGDRVDAAAALAGLLANRPTGSSLVIEALDGSSVEEYMTVAGERIHMPVMALVDGGTEGAAALLAALLGAAGRGVMLIGSPTAADCGLRAGIPAGDGVRLYVRVRRVRLDGRYMCAEMGQDGVMPHLVVERPVRGRPDGEEPRAPARGDNREPTAEDRALRVRVRRDPVLERAVDILLGLKAMERFIPDASPGASGADPADTSGTWWVP